MSNFLIALLVSVGSGTWIYNKMFSRTGGNTKSALTVAGVSGGLLFVAVLIILQIISNALS